MPTMKPIILCFFLLSSLSTYASPVSHFESPEHLIIGDHVKLSFYKDEPGKVGHIFQTPNGLSLSYGELITLGDFYGVKDASISDGKTPEERQSIFLSAFATFSTEETTVTETQQILDVIYSELKAVQKGMEEGKSAEEIYAAIAGEANRQFNCITGGGCGKNYWLFPGRYLTLAIDNCDHFGNDAWMAYQAGHELAIKEAIAAKATQDIHKLERAYMLNAFACHFLTDSFATGHIRTPRRLIRDEVTPSLIGSILANYMHDEENKSGLHVHNLRGDRWIAYGDRSYLNDKNTKARQIIAEIMQASADHIFQAYLEGKSFVHSEEDIYRLAPIADEVQDQGAVDLSPLFYFDTQTNQLMRRAETSNLYDRHFTADWWGWTTLIRLARERGLPSEGQASLALSSISRKALNEGLITEPEIIEFIERSWSSLPQKTLGATLQKSDRHD